MVAFAAKKRAAPKKSEPEKTGSRGEPRRERHTTPRTQAPNAPRHERRGQQPGKAQRPRRPRPPGQGSQEPRRQQTQRPRSNPARKPRTAQPPEQTPTPATTPERQTPRRTGKTAPRRQRTPRTTAPQERPERHNKQRDQQQTTNSKTNKSNGHGKHPQSRTPGGSGNRPPPRHPPKSTRAQRPVAVRGAGGVHRTQKQHRTPPAPGLRRVLHWYGSAAAVQPSLIWLGAAAPPRKRKFFFVGAVGFLVSEEALSDRRRFGPRLALILPWQLRPVSAVRCAGLFLTAGALPQK